jgi:hypothetical protein
MVGGSVVIELALSSLFLRSRRRFRRAPARLAENEAPRAERLHFPAEQHSNGSIDGAASPSRTHLTSPNGAGFLGGRFQEEIDKVKGMAIGYVMGLARDSIKEAVPQLASQIDEVMNSVTTKLGSKPV